MALASLFPWTWATPQSSRVIVTCKASAFHRASSGGDAAVRSRKKGRRAAAFLCIRQCLLGLAPACKQLRRCTLEKVVAAVISVELFPGDRRGHRGSFASARRIRHDRGRAALIAQPVEEDPAL